jgi:hypothetical protein
MAAPTSKPPSKPVQALKIKILMKKYILISKYLQDRCTAFPRKDPDAGRNRPGLQRTNRLKFYYTMQKSIVKAK